MTNRKCGTCRFYEVSTLQTHGWCRNAAYPRRDELALLRETELGCRSGWEKDYWEQRSEAARPEEVSAASEASSAKVGAMPLGTGIAPLIAAETPTAPRGDARPPATGAAPVGPAGGQDVVVGLDARLGRHPELAENGVPLPRPRRSAVAEAHKRALERREAERASSAERRDALGNQPAVATYRPAPEATAGWPAPAPPREAVTEPVASPPAPPVRETPVARESRPFLTGSPVPASPPERPPREEIPVATARPALRREERDEASGPAVASAAPERPAVPAARPSTEGATMPNVPTPNAQPGEPRYWDQPAPGRRFTRMTPPPPAPEVAPARQSAPDEVTRPIQPVGRAEAEPAPATERPARPIRPLAATQPVEAPKPEARPAFPRNQRRGGQAGPPPAPKAAEAAQAPPPLPPRQIDPALLRQLEDEWREQALQAQAGKHCGNCRYFHAVQGGERRICGCQFAQSYRQPVASGQLGCLGPLGSWWAANDEGWLQKAELERPRRATPLLDALERELAERARPAQSGAERRRNTR